MRAVRIEQPGSARGLRLVEVEEPVPGPGEIQVEVHATALNRADWLQILGKYPVPAGTPADLPGMEYAGTVRAVGPRAARFRPGDRVMGIVPGAAFAERLVTHEREAVPIPEAVPLTDAAAIPEAFFTAFDALVRQGGLGTGERVLVHAVASGVGTAAAQIVHASGATTLGTGRDAGKLERAAALVPFTALTVARDAPRFAERVLELTGGAGVDLVLDLVGGRYTAESLACLAPRGRMMLVGTVDGVKSELDLRLVLGKRVQITGTVLRARPLEEKMALARSVERHVLPLFASGVYRPVVDRVLPVTRVEEAFETLVADRNVGKIVLAWSDR
jgi:putative PIG3 family NAD(P)H quinone oxidoreductase